MHIRGNKLLTKSPGIKRFEPAKRFAILINMWTETVISPEESYSPFHPVHGPHLGDQQTFLLETLLSKWRIDFGEDVNRVVDEYFGRNRERFLEELETYKERHYFGRVEALSGYNEDLSAQARGALKIYADVAFDLPLLEDRVPYDGVITIPPFSATQGRLIEAIARVDQYALDNTLTMLFVSGEGNQEKVSGNYDLGYSMILDRLSQLPGKKLIILLTCFSGSFINILKHHRSRNDFVVITSSSADEKATNWGNDAVLKELVSQTMDQVPLSEYRFNTQVHSGISQTPEVFGYFDLVI